MLHVVPILCLIFFILYIEFQLKKEMHNIEQEFKEVKEKILNNRSEIYVNREKIEQNRIDIDKLNDDQRLQ